MKYITEKFEIGEEIEVPKGAANSNVTIIADYDGGPIAVLTYVQLTEDEARELKARMMRGTQGSLIQ